MWLTALVGDRRGPAGRQARIAAAHACDCYGCGACGPAAGRDARPFARSTGARRAACAGGRHACRAQRCGAPPTETAKHGYECEKLVVPSRGSTALPLSPTVGMSISNSFVLSATSCGAVQGVYRPATQPDPQAHHPAPPAPSRLSRRGLGGCRACASPATDVRRAQHACVLASAA